MRSNDWEVQVKRSVKQSVKKQHRTSTRRKKGLEKAVKFIQDGNSKGSSSVLGSKRKGSPTDSIKIKKSNQSKEERLKQRNEQNFIRTIQNEEQVQHQNVIHDVEHMETQSAYDNGVLDSLKKNEEENRKKAEKVLVEVDTPLYTTKDFCKFIEEQKHVEETQKKRAASSSNTRRKNNFSNSGEKDPREGVLDNGKGRRYKEMGESAWFVPSTDLIFKYLSSLTPYWESFLKDEQIKSMKGRPDEKFHFCSSKHVAIMLRERYSIFRGCVGGKCCIAYEKWNINTMEYLSPEDYNKVITTGVHPNINENWCYICILSTLNKEYFRNHTLQNNATELTKIFYHKHCLGEYRRDAFLPPITKVNDEEAFIPNAVCGPCSSTGETAEFTDSGENTYGLTHHLRAFVPKEYYLGTKISVDIPAVMNGDGKPRTVYVRRLVECPEVLYTYNTHTREPYRLIQPYTYVSREVDKPHSTTKALKRYLATGTNHGVVCLRLRHEPGKTSRSKKGVQPDEPRKKVTTMPLTRYLGHDLAKRFEAWNCPNGHEPFPFDLLVCKNLRKAAQQIERILRGGRIELDKLFVVDEKSGLPCLRISYNYDVDLTKNLDWYSNQMNDSRYSKYRFYISIILRMFLLRTLLINYPRSDNSRNDARVCKLITIFMEWNEEYVKRFGIKLREDGTYAPAEDPIMDIDVDDREMDALRNREMETYEYAEDHSFLTYRTEVRVRPTPVQEIKTYLQANPLPQNDRMMLSTTVHDTEKLNSCNMYDINCWMLCDFEQARVYFQKTMNEYRIKELWDSRGTHFMCGSEKALEQMSVDMWKKEYSIIILLLLRVNHAYEQQKMLITTKRDKLSFILEEKNEECMRLYDKYSNLDKTYVAKKNRNKKANSEESPEDITTRKRIDKETRNIEALKQKMLNTLNLKRKEYKEIKEEYLKARRICYVYRLFVYTHLSLAQRIMSLCIVSDKALMSAVVRKETRYLPFISHYQESYPWQTRTPEEGYLPLLGIAMCAATFVDNKPTEAFDEQFASHSFFKSVRKAMPRVCQTRTNDKSHVEVCCDSMSYTDLTVLAVELSMLGCYEHALEQPSFSQAISIYEWLGVNFDEYSFIKWQKTHGKMVVCIMREMFCFQYEVFEPYEQHIINMYDGYVLFKKKVQKSADVMRAFLGRGASSTECEALMLRLWPTSSRQKEEEPKEKVDMDALGEFEMKIMDDTYVEEQEVLSKNPTMYDMVMDERYTVESEWEKSIEWNNVTEDDFVMYQSVYDKLEDLESFDAADRTEEEVEVMRIAKLELEAKDIKFNVYHNTSEDPLRSLCKHMRIVNDARQDKYDRLELPRVLRDIILTRILSIFPGSTIDLEILLEFNFGQSAKAFNANIKINTIQNLITVMRMIGNRARPEYICRVLDTIKGKDWEIIDTYFNALMQHYSVRIFKLGNGAYEKNCKALCKRYHVKDISELSHYAYSMLFSMCCNSCPTYVAQTSSVKHYGHESMFISTFSEDMAPYCKAGHSKTKKLRKARKVRTMYTKVRKCLLSENPSLSAEVIHNLKNDQLTSNRNHRYHNQPFCGEFPMMVAPLLGCVVQHTEINTNSDSTASTASSLPVTRAYALCNLCACVSRFSLRMIGPNGFTCTKCVVHDKQNEARDFFLPPCVCCRRLIRTPKFMVAKKFFAIDNRDRYGDYKPRLCFVCLHCENRKASNFNYDMITTKDINLCMRFNANMKEKIRILENMKRFTYDKKGGAYIQDVTGHDLTSSSRSNKR